MTTNNHSAHGPVSLDRLRQIREILSKAAAQSDGGNLGYAMADAVKVIDEVLERRKTDRAAAAWKKFHSMLSPDDPAAPQPAPVAQCPFPCGWDNLNKLAIQDAAFVSRGLVEGEEVTEAQRQAVIANNDRLLKVISACRAAMLQAEPVIQPYKLSPNSFTDEDLKMMAHGDNPQSNAYRELLAFRRNSPVAPDGWIQVSERMPEAHEPIYIFHPDYGVDEGVWYDNQEDAFLWDSDCSRCRAIETVSHWMPMPALPAAPQQGDVK
ncbi:hypothetical protein BEH70_23790 [Citrobacter freundii]|uniref:DUF551 domain-containing protein n=1 Tax=Citrobacter TaxID=544 RepID=UPI0008FD1418|nr:DUF551 domain-containing protein [Citrobacter sp. Cf101]ELK7473487.1 DUF551 domain-containing protein [Citrobacter freundii]MDM3189124.1 DUF551 domain-containing protein [Citrobacter sp. Cf101]OIZ35867.1 hypothetical protein BEH70_23790 [Citrobacter freundii]